MIADLRPRLHCGVALPPMGPAPDRRADWTLPLIFAVAAAALSAVIAAWGGV